MATLCRRRFDKFASQSVSACISSCVMRASFSIVTLNVRRRSLPVILRGQLGIVFSLSSDRPERAVGFDVGGGTGFAGCLGGLSEGKRNMSGILSGWDAGFGRGSWRFEVRRFFVVVSDGRDMLCRDCRSMRDSLGLADLSG